MPSVSMHMHLALVHFNIFKSHTKRDLASESRANATFNLHANISRVFVCVCSNWNTVHNNYFMELIAATLPQPTSVFHVVFESFRFFGAFFPNTSISLDTFCRHRKAFLFFHRSCDFSSTSLILCSSLNSTKATHSFKTSSLPLFFSFFPALNNNMLHL